MAVTSTSPLKPISPKNKPNPDSPKRNSSPIRRSSSSKRVKCVKDQVFEEELTELETKTSCHQCRQKTTSLVATCKNVRRNKICNISFCRKCLFNRYGEKAEEVGLLNDWNCPICKSICNCSICMKKKGEKPTGTLVHTAKATGYFSVFDMLNRKKTETLNAAMFAKDCTSLPQNTDVSKEHVVASPMKTGKENIFAGKSGSKLQVNSLTANFGAKNVAECQQNNIETSNSDVKVCQGKENSEVENSISKKSKVLKERKLNSMNGEMTVEKDRDGAIAAIKRFTKPCNAKESSQKKIKRSRKTNPLMTIFKDVSEKCIKKDVEVIELDDCSDDEKKMPKSGSTGNDQLECNSTLNSSEREDLKMELSDAVIVPEIKASEKFSIAADFQMLDSEEISEACIDNVDMVVDGNVSWSADEKIIPHSVTDDEQIISNPSPTLRDLKNSMKIHDASFDAGISPPQGFNVSPTIRKLKNSMKIHNASFDAGISPPQGIDASPTTCELKNSRKIVDASFDAGISLPQGIDVTSVAGIDMPPEDVGHALQFLEFCKAFGQFFRLTKSQPESILRELTRGCGRRSRTQYSSVVQFQIQLLSLLLKDTKEESLSLTPTSSGNSWLQALGKCISESKCTFDGLPSNCFNKDGSGYAMLDSSQKLRLLNFLCDEALCTPDLRTWIDEQNSIHIEKEKEARQMVLTAKEKEKQTKQQMQIEIERATANGKPLSITEHDELVSKMKKEAENAHTEMLQAMEKIPKTKQRSDAVRTDSILFDGKGHVFWRLKSCSRNSNILVQDVGSLDTATAKDKWFTYDDVEQKGMVDRYISSRGKRVKLQKCTNFLMSETYQA